MNPIDQFKQERAEAMENISKNATLKQKSID